jgi:L-ribulose-5-phosphate 3-epimerase
MANLFGTIQGRLLPKYKSRYQAHPVGYWEDEFHIAKDLNLDCIEFILDYNDANQNPLLNSNELIKIESIASETGVVVKTICADYFMEAPLHSKDDAVSEKSILILKKLLENSIKLNVSNIVIPCVDQSSLSDDKSVLRFIQQINKVIPYIEEKSINLSLETDLGPDKFVELLNQFDSKRITVNYDIGNSASLGFDPLEELDAYGDRITDIHIKDRLLNGGPVLLGEGNANFELFFTKLKEFNYKGPFIMQAYRDNDGISIFKEQLNYILSIMDRYY